jgi:hypothetical protein
MIYHNNTDFEISSTIRNIVNPCLKVNEVVEGWRSLESSRRSAGGVGPWGRLGIVARRFFGSRHWGQRGAIHNDAFQQDCLRAAPSTVITSLTIVAGLTSRPDII